MFVIFGWGRQIKWDIGPTHSMTCSHCHHENYFLLQRITTWFTLFFIPIFPYEWYYFLYCPVCQYGIKLNSEQFDILKPIAQLNQKLVDGSITKEEYVDALEDLSSEKKEEEKLENRIEKEEVKLEEPKTIKKQTAKSKTKAGLKRCPYCDEEIKAEAKKCKYCKERIE